MPNPYKPRNPRVTGDEVDDHKTGFRRRLALLGATPDEIEAMTNGWDDLDDDWTEEARQSWIDADDEVVLDEIHRIRAEYQAATTTPEDEAAAVAALIETGEVHKALEGTVAEVETWVGSNRIRALAAADVEFGEGGKERKGVAAYLDPLIQ